MSQPKTIPLANGVQLPFVFQGCAFGDWTGQTEFQGFLPEQAWRATTLALKVGFRAFDGAHAYDTERQVGTVLGKAFAKGSLTRDDVFLTTKIAHPLAPPHVGISHQRTWNLRDVPSIRQKVLDDFDTSLRDIGVGRFDLVLIHWPGNFNEKDYEFAKKARAEIWETLEHLLKVGTAKAIGVSNFSKKHLEDLFQTAKVKPMVNQIEFHPYCQYHDVVKFCRDNGIVVQAYAPFASGRRGLLNDSIIKGIADRIGKSVCQVILRWNVQQGNSVIPKSNSEARMAQNLEIFDFVLSDEDMAAITALHPPGTPSRRSCPDLNDVQ